MAAPRYLLLPDQSQATLPQEGEAIPPQHHYTFPALVRSGGRASRLYIIKSKACIGEISNGSHFVAI